MQYAERPVDLTNCDREPIHMLEKFSHRALILRTFKRDFDNFLHLNEACETPPGKCKIAKTCRPLGSSNFRAYDQGIFKGEKHEKIVCSGGNGRH